MTLSYPLPFKSTEEANLFLRCLWAEMRKEFTDLAWLYRPRRDGEKKIYIAGDISFGGNNKLTVYCKYQQRGLINRIFLVKHPFASGPSEKEWMILDQCVSRTFEAYVSPKYFSYGSRINALPDRGFHPYQGKGWGIVQVVDGGSILEIDIACYDGYDGLYQATNKFWEVVDFLSVSTNALIELEEVSRRENLEDTDAKSLINKTFNDEVDWIDDCPIIQGRYALSRSQTAILDLIVSGDHNVIEKYALSWKHFHDSIRVSVTAGRDKELSEVLAVSALEVASDIWKSDNLKCEHCKQTIYGIKQRVRDFVRSHSGEALDYWIRDYYDSRSKFLHSGSRTPFSSRTPWLYGMIIPTLVGGDNHGFIGGRSRGTKNLIEIASHALRAHMASTLLSDEQNQ